MSTDNKPKFQPWNEEEFQSDLYVRMMTPVQRWMYRTLLQQCFYHTTRPYLPNDPDLLWFLAGCESKEQWDANSAPVIRRFKVLAGNNALLENKRAVKDWESWQDIKYDAIEQGRLGGEKSAEVRRQKYGTAQPNPPSNPLPDQPNILRSGPEAIEVNRSEMNLSEAKRSEDKLNEIKRNSNHALLFSSNGANAPYPEKAKEVQPDYLQFRRTWHGRVRASGKLGKSSFFVDKYMAACNSYGAAKVEAAFMTWSESQRDWKWAEDHKHAFFSFLKKLPEYVEEDDEVLPTPTAVAADEEIPSATPEQLAGADDSISACIAAEKKAREDRIKKFGRGGPVNEGSPLDYLAEVTRGQ